MADLMRQGRLKKRQELLDLAMIQLSESMGRWTEGRVTVSGEKLRKVSLETILGELEPNKTKNNTVWFHVRGKSDYGKIAFLFDDQSGKQLAQILLGTKTNLEEPFTSLERSALTEIGNVFSCGCLNTLSDLIQEELVPSVPLLVREKAAVSIQTLWDCSSTFSGRLFFAPAHFHHGKEKITWWIFLLPTTNLETKANAALDGPWSSTQHGLATECLA